MSEEKDKKFQLGPALSTSFVDFKFSSDSKTYYKQFSGDAQTLNIKNEEGDVLASVVCYTKELFQKNVGLVKGLIVVDIRTQNTRAALIGWSEKLTREILKFKKECGADFALFLLSRREEKVFNVFSRPRKKREDQIMFNHLRSLELCVVQGKKFLAEAPLKHVTIRRAEKKDLEAYRVFAKRSSEGMLISRYLREGALAEELSSWDGMGIEDIALACDHEGNIVGSLGVFDPDAEKHYAFDQIKDVTFLANQQVLQFGSWLLDQRPIVEGKRTPLKIFTHMYFNNSDIFYSLVCWWLKQTQKERNVFMYPHYKGALKTKPSEDLHVNEFEADLFLIQESGESQLELLKPSPFSEALDLDLPMIF